MFESKEILAKSEMYGKVSLLDHTTHVVEMIKIISDGFSHPFKKDLAIKGAILHDLGKAHPFFQKIISGYKPKSLFESRKFKSFQHRHEISSLTMLAAFPKSEWDILIEMVVAHHKSVENDKSQKGIIDLNLNSEDERWIDDHIGEWHLWFPFAKEIIEHFGYECKFLHESDARAGLKYALSYCQQIEYGWSPWRGLLKSADHYASAFNFKYFTRTTPLFQTPNLGFYKADNRKSDLYPLSKMDTIDFRPHTIVVAPTGAGKTDFLLNRTKGRIFYTLPFQASINAMYDRFRDTILPRDGIRLKHGTSRIKVGEEIDEEIEQDLVGSSVKILTPHQLAGIIFGIKNFEITMLDIQECDVILDEIHTYSDVSQSMVIEIVKALLYLKCRIHIGTATMPKPLYDIVLQILGGKTNVYEVSLPKEIISEFNRHIIFKHNEDFESVNIQEIIENSVLREEKLLIIFNTIKEAQQAYSVILRQFPHVKKMLIHSRFKRGDRVRLEKVLTDNFNESGDACIVVSTQVVEVSLDISFDRMITQAAPLDSLAQRFGRINRIRTKESVGTYKPIHVLSPRSSTLPYNKHIVKLSFDLLPDQGNILEEIRLQDMIDQVYHNIDLLPIDFHLKFKNNNIILKKLTDNPKSILIEALEIDGATCILEADREKYINAIWKERVHLEIPISFRTLRYYSRQYEQLKDTGSNPFVVPQDEIDYKTYGLQLVEHDNFL